MTENQEKIKAMIEAYGEEAPDFQASLRDLLTDVYHVALDMELDVEAALDGAYEVFEMEREEGV